MVTLEHTLDSSSCCCWQCVGVAMGNGDGSGLCLGSCTVALCTHGGFGNFYQPQALHCRQAGSHWCSRSPWCRLVIRHSCHVRCSKARFGPAWAWPCYMSFGGDRPSLCALMCTPDLSVCTPDCSVRRLRGCTRACVPCRAAQKGSFSVEQFCCFFFNFLFLWLCAVGVVSCVQRRY